MNFGFRQTWIRFLVLLLTDNMILFFWVSVFLPIKLSTCIRKITKIHFNTTCYDSGCCSLRVQEERWASEEFKSCLTISQYPKVYPISHLIVHHQIVFPNTSWRQLTCFCCCSSWTQRTECSLIGCSSFHGCQAMHNLMVCWSNAGLLKWVAWGTTIQGCLPFSGKDLR